MEKINRVYQKDLMRLDPNGRLCEICNKRTHFHVWIDMDEQGFAVNCSNERT